MGDRDFFLHRSFEWGQKQGVFHRKISLDIHSLSAGYMNNNTINTFKKHLSILSPELVVQFL